VRYFNRNRINTISTRKRWEFYLYM
jgi:hypothetical protein